MCVWKFQRLLGTIYYIEVVGLPNSHYFISIVMAAASIANIVKSSLGPVGLDKMLVDDIGVSSATCFFKLMRS